jgi:potassium-transporting ATPase KdpC subunit
MFQLLLSSLRLTLVCAVLFTGLYPLFLCSVAPLAPSQGQGIRLDNGQYAGIGQRFQEEKYFWSRPSAAAYNAAASCGSNKGPTNPDYLAEVQGRRDTFLAHHPYWRGRPVPADLVTASGSGLDPHLSLAAAAAQAPRVAQARKMDPLLVQQCIRNCTEAPVAGFLGPETVHVLRLNLALDQLSQQQ